MQYHRDYFARPRLAWESPRAFHFASDRCGNLQSRWILLAEIAAKSSLAARPGCCSLGPYD
jgi:hypothetical protein